MMVNIIIYTFLTLWLKKVPNLEKGGLKSYVLGHSPQNTASTFHSAAFFSCNSAKTADQRGAKWGEQPTDIKSKWKNASSIQPLEE